jgi:hypothetical protein
MDEEAHVLKERLMLARPFEINGKYDAQIMAENHIPIAAFPKHWLKVYKLWQSISLRES